MTLIPILLYHSINDRPAPDIAPWTVPPELFNEHLSSIVNSGRTPLTITSLVRAMAGLQPLPERPLAITFDDGYADTLSAARALAEMDIPSTVYIATGSMDQPGMLSRADVAALGRIAGVEIGAHSVSHAHLDELSQSQINAEVQPPRVALETLTAAPCCSFAYPYGDHDDRVVRAVRRAGYTSAVAVKNALSHSDDDIFALARVTVTPRMSAASLEHVLAGQYAVAQSGERWRTRGYRRFRRMRRRLAAASGPA